MSIRKAERNRSLHVFFDLVQKTMRTLCDCRVLRHCAATKRRNGAPNIKTSHSARNLSRSCPQSDARHTIITLKHNLTTTSSQTDFKIHNHAVNEVHFESPHKNAVTASQNRTEPRFLPPNTQVHCDNTDSLVRHHHCTFPTCVQSTNDGKYHGKFF